MSLNDFGVEDVREEGGVGVDVGDDFVEGPWGVREGTGCRDGLSGRVRVGRREREPGEEGSPLLQLSL